MRMLSSCAVAVLVLISAPGAASAYDETTPAVIANKDLRLMFSPVLLVPPTDRPVGGGLALELRYGIGADPVIIAPGGRLTGYFLSGHPVFMGMPTVRVTLPAGPVAPYLTTGAGLGVVVSSTDEGSDKVQATGLALMGGGGLMVHIGRAVGLGVEVTYQTITSSDFGAVAIGGALILGL